ncbi:MAG: glutamate racemase [Dictyoglomaceae bacterium]|nr:glutamate racemase [Dictyoglomaceae bacterium]
MKKLGILDSGVGGLTVLKSLIETNKLSQVIYFADTKYFPYGIKPVDFIQRRVEEIINFFLREEVEEVIIACNTASSTAYEYLKSKFSIPVYSIVNSAIWGLSKFRGKKIGVLATRRTLESGIYPKMIKKINPEIEVFVESCSEGPLLETIEEGIIEGEIIEGELFKCMIPLIKRNIEGLILGCTHLPFISPVIRKNYPNIKVIDPSEEIVNIVKLDNERVEEVKVDIFVTNNEIEFQEILRKLLKVNWDVKKIDWERSEVGAFKGEINKKI